MVEKELFEDWIEDRDHETFTKRYGGPGIDWASKAGKDHGISSLIYRLDETLDKAETIKRSYNIAKTRIASMGLFDVKMSLSQETSSYSGNKIMRISTEIFDREDMNTSQKMDVFLGEVVHESAHALYSEFFWLTKMINALDASSRRAKLKVKLVKIIMNILEDEMIERKVGKDFPGYTNYLAATKKAYFDKKEEEEESNKLPDVLRLLNLFLKFIRYPKNINESEVKKYKPFLFKLKKLFEGDFPKNSEQVYEKAMQVYKLMKKHYEMPEPSKKDPKKEEKSESGSSDESEKGESDPGSGEKGSDTSDKKEKSKSSGSSGSKESEEKEGEDDGEGENSSDSDDPGSGKEEGKPSSDETSETGEEDEKSEEKSKKERKDFLKDMWGAKDKLKTLESETDSSLTDFSKKKVNVSKSIEESSIGKYIIEGDVETVDEGFLTKITAVKAGNKSEYMNHYKAIKPVVGKLVKQLEVETFQKEQILKGLRSGKLDESKIVEAAYGVQTVYMNRTEKIVRGGHIALLIDESGSMSNRLKTDDSLSLIGLATRIAILFVEALNRTKINYYIYGHTADRALFDDETIVSIMKKAQLRIFKEPGIKFNRYALSRLDAIANNRDGDAIRMAGKRLHEFAKEPATLIVISDGEPAAYGYRGIEDSRRAVLEMEKLGVTTIGIGMNVSYALNRIYNHYVNFRNMDAMPAEIGKIIRKIFKKR